MPRRGNNAWSQRLRRRSPPAPYNVGDAGWRRGLAQARVLEGTLLYRDIPIMDAGLKGRQVRGFGPRARPADTFDLRACSRFWIPFRVSQPSYKVRAPFLFILEFYQGALARGNYCVDLTSSPVASRLSSFLPSRSAASLLLVLP